MEHKDWPHWDWSGPIIPQHLKPWEIRIAQQLVANPNQQPDTDAETLRDLLCRPDFRGYVHYYLPEEASFGYEKHDRVKAAPTAWRSILIDDLLEKYCRLMWEQARQPLDSSPGAQRMTARQEPGEGPGTGPGGSGRNE